MLSKCLLSQRDRLSTAYKTVPTLMHPGSVTESTGTFNSPNKQHIPSRVRKWLENRPARILRWRGMISSTHIEVSIYYWDKQGYSVEYMTAILAWLVLCCKHSGLTTLFIEILGTPVTRYLSKGEKQLTPNNVNGGFTISKNDEASICVYRQQEWFKVFIHETVHAFGFEPTLTTLSDIKCAKIIGFSQPYSLRETYCELVARINQCVFDAYRREPGSVAFLTTVRRNLMNESYFSIAQARNLLDSQNIRLEDGLDSWKEATEGIAYFVYTAGALANVAGALEWMCTSTESLSKFKGNQKSVEKLCQLIQAGLKRNIDVKMAVTGYLDIKKLP